MTLQECTGILIYSNPWLPDLIIATTVSLISSVSTQAILFNCPTRAKLDSELSELGTDPCKVSCSPIYAHDPAFGVHAPSMCCTESTSVFTPWLGSSSSLWEGSTPNHLGEPSQSPSDSRNLGPRELRDSMAKCLKALVIPTSITSQAISWSNICWGLGVRPSPLVLLQ